MLYTRKNNTDTIIEAFNPQTGNQEGWSLVRLQLGDSRTKTVRTIVAQDVPFVDRVNWPSSTILKITFSILDVRKSTNLPLLSPSMTSAQQVAVWRKYFTARAGFPMTLTLPNNERYTCVLQSFEFGETANNRNHITLTCFATS